MPLARRWPPGAGWWLRAPIPTSGWRGDPPRAAVCPGHPAGGAAGQARRGPEEGRGQGSLGSRRAVQFPRLRRAGQPALLPPAPAPPRLLRPPPPPPPPPPAPPRRLIDGSLKKSAEPCWPRLASSGTPALQPAARPHGAAPPARTVVAHRAPRPRPSRAPRPRGSRRPEREGRPRPSSAPWRESEPPTKKVPAENERARQSPHTFLRKPGGWGSLTQVRCIRSRGAGTVLLSISEISRRPPHLPLSSAGRCPLSRRSCAPAFRAPGRKQGTGGLREGGRLRGGLAPSRLSGSHGAAQVLGPPVPLPRLARAALWAPAGEKRSSLLGFSACVFGRRVFVCFVLFLWRLHRAAATRWK